jgi:hypothetical protein
MTFREFVRRSPIGFLRSFLGFHLGSPQTDEDDILDELAAKVDPPKSFVEFGFNVREFNCQRLAKRWPGLVIDGDPLTVSRAQAILPKRVRAVQQFITLENLDVVARAFPKGTLGVLSIDVDGNDYWFLKQLLPLEPAIVSVEYNASFGDRSITVPYDPTFVRSRKHPTGWYAGASLPALASLCEAHGYDLVKVSEGGANIFFVRRDKRPASLPALTHREAYRELALRNRHSGLTAAQQWEKIADMPYVTV